jgi:predicted dithiol-disulfide oxidoreductase (DUF899 family)
MTELDTKREVVCRAHWVESRMSLLEKEKELTRQQDELVSLRRELPWEPTPNRYIFTGRNGDQSLSDLIEGRSQLVTYHFMFGPGWKEGCPSCSLLGDHFDGSLVHLANRDVTFVAVSRAPWAEIEAFQERMGWHFNWVSSHGSDFNFDFGVSFRNEDKVDGKVEYNYARQRFPQDEAPGFSVFYKDGSGDIFHTYSTYGRGVETFIGAYHFLDMTPKGRDEGGLTFPMAWVRHHDRYDSAPASCCHGAGK